MEILLLVESLVIDDSLVIVMSLVVVRMMVLVRLVVVESLVQDLHLNQNCQGWTAASSGLTVSTKILHLRYVQSMDYFLFQFYFGLMSVHQIKQDSQKSFWIVLGEEFKKSFRRRNSLFSAFLN